MKILFIHNLYKQEGGEDIAVDLESALLEEKGHEVQKIIFDNKNIEGGVIKNIQSAWNAVYNRTSARRVEQIIKTFRPDIIHIHNLFFVASPSTLFSAAKFKIPVILSLHNYRLICCNALLLRNMQVCELCVQKQIPLKGIQYKCYRNSRTQSAVVTMITGIHKLWGTWQQKVTRYIALTEFSRSRLMASSLKLSDDKIVIKPNFVNDLGEGNWPRENFFLFVGRIAKEKGIFILLEAFASMPECNLLVAGEGPEKEYLQKKYSQYTNIVFAGKMKKNDVISNMKKCKALIFPSIWYEGLPFTIIEAFSTGTPVIASRLGSMAELIQDGYNGYHFVPASVNDLREKVLLHVNTNSHDMYSQARQTYLIKYHPDIHYNSILNIYTSAIAENKASHV